MSDLLTLIGALYACNLTAERAPLPFDQVQSCVDVHETVMARFLTRDEVTLLGGLPISRQYKIKLRGYRRFKKWEKENPEIAGGIRAEQSQRLAPQTSTIGAPFSISQDQTLNDLVYAHYRCDAEMTVRRLSGAEIAVCGTLYTRLKLHFLKEIDRENYKTISPEDQSAASKRGYLAFKKWEAANSTLVAELEAKAKSKSQKSY